MRLNLDSAQMRSCMGLWRDAIAPPPGHADGPTPEERARLMAHIAGIVAGWSDLLRLASAESDQEQRELIDITTQIAEFKVWADEARMALALLDSARRVPPKLEGASPDT